MSHTNGAASRMAPTGASSPKILSLEALKGVIAAAKRKGKKVAMCHGVFDLLHPGHVVHLHQARRQGDMLVGLDPC